MVEANATVEPVTLSRLKLSGLLQAQRGKFVTCEFVKQDGSVRKLNGRLGVTKHLRGGGPSKIAASDKPYVTVFDVQCKDYRVINLETVFAIRASSIQYRIA